MKDDSCIFVAQSGDMIIGYLCGGIIEGEDYRILPISAEVENTFIREEYRSQGIGKRLLERFTDWCRSKDVKKLKVKVSADNKLAINFYRNNNFKNYTLELESDL